MKKVTKSATIAAVAVSVLAGGVLAAPAASAAQPAAKVKTSLLLNQSEMAQVMNSETPIEMIDPPTTNKVSAITTYGGYALGSKFLAGVGYDYIGNLNFKKGCKAFAKDFQATTSKSSNYSCTGERVANDGSHAYYYIRNVGKGYDAAGITVIDEADVPLMGSLMKTKAQNIAMEQALKLNKNGIGTLATR